MNRRTLHLVRLLGAALAVAAAMALAGCQISYSGDEGRIEELEQQVEELQGQLDEKEAASEGDDSGEKDAEAEKAAEEKAAKAAESEDDVLAAYPEVADFSERADKLIAECDGIERSSSYDKNFEAYLDMEAKVNALDNEMDRYDDELEHAARSGDISREDYVAVERELDYIDDRLSAAEDSLEYRLGVDD